MIADTGNAQILIPDPPAIMAENPVAENRMIAKTEEAEAEPKMHLYGNSRITFYCHCATCNGRAGANTASGVQPTVNHTVATGSLPFGTRVLIDGVEYTVEDRGVGDFQFDIFVSSHEEALQRGLYYTDVYILDN